MKYNFVLFAVIIPEVSNFQSMFPHMKESITCHRPNPKSALCNLNYKETIKFHDDNMSLQITYKLSSHKWLNYCPVDDNFLILTGTARMPHQGCGGEWLLSDHCW